MYDEVVIHYKLSCIGSVSECPIPRQGPDKQVVSIGINISAPCSHGYESYHKLGKCPGELKSNR